MFVSRKSNVSSYLHSFPIHVTQTAIVSLQIHTTQQRIPALTPSIFLDSCVSILLNARWPKALHSASSGTQRRFYINRPTIAAAASGILSQKQVLASSPHRNTSQCRVPTAVPPSESHVRTVLLLPPSRGADLPLHHSSASQTLLSGVVRRRSAVPRDQRRLDVTRCLPPFPHQRQTVTNSGNISRS
jgi:hypothetical protein